MNRKPIEIYAIWDLPDGKQGVQTGIYLFNINTLEDVYELLKSYEKRGGRMPSRFEVAMAQFEEDENNE